MGTVNLVIDGQPVAARDTDTILDAARSAGIYIPTLCNHPDLPPAGGKTPASAVYHGQAKIENAKSGDLTGCGLCVVEVAGEAEPKPACATLVADGMAISTGSPALQEIRRQKLAPILARHPHACLTCAQATGCSRSQCSSNVAEEERCCPKFGHCEFQDVVGYLGISSKTPRWLPKREPVLDAEPLLVRDYTLCVGCTRCVRVCDDLRGVGALGWVWDAEGKVQVGSLAPGLAESGCRFCTACVEVCPTGAITDKTLGQGAFAARLAPCKSACPAGIDVPEYVRLIADGKPEAALATVRETVPLSGVLGRVCVHPCEDACRRAQLNDSVSICLLKRFASDNGGKVWKQEITKSPDSGRKVAIVGAGPAGLTAAFFLAKKGHGVTIFEAGGQAGGMLRYGIPVFRLPEAVLEAEINAIKSLGVVIQTGSKIESLSDLQAQGYDAVFLAVGAQLSRRMPLRGADQKHVVWGLDFLKALRRGESLQAGAKVVVVGGGNVAIDVAMSALRQGAQTVDVVCLEKRDEMPAHSGEVEGAVAEGVKLHDSWGPTAISPDHISFRRCLSVFDSQSVFNPLYDDSNTMQLEADQVILAIGQATDLALAEDSKIALAKGLLVVDERTLETGEPGVFAGGYAVAMPGTVIHAVAAGRKAAASIDKYLGGDGDLALKLMGHEPPSPRLGRVEGFADLKRVQPAERDPAQRKTDYNEVCLGFSADDARAEAERCLRCQLRLMLNAPPSPPKHVLPLSEDSLGLVPQGEGVLVLFDGGRNILAIHGVENLQEAVRDRLGGESAAEFFEFEEDPMFSKAESERIQAYLQQHGSMPPGDGSDDDDLDDLF